MRADACGVEWHSTPNRDRLVTSAARNMNSWSAAIPKSRSATDLWPPATIRRTMLDAEQPIAGQESQQLKGIGPRTRSSPTRRSILKPHTRTPVPCRIAPPRAHYRRARKTIGGVQEPTDHPMRILVHRVVPPAKRARLPIREAWFTPDRYATTSSPLPPSITMCLMRPR